MIGMISEEMIEINNLHPQIIPIIIFIRNHHSKIIINKKGMNRFRFIPFKIILQTRL